MAEGEAPDLQFTPDGVNVAVKQDGALDVQPTISVSTTSDASNQEPVEISEITGQFEKVQVGDGSNVIYRKGEHYQSVKVGSWRRGAMNKGNQKASREVNNAEELRLEERCSEEGKPESAKRGKYRRHGSETLEQPVPSAEDASIRKGREKIKRKSEDLVSREEMQTYVKRAIDESMITHTKTDPISKVEQEGGLMIIGREGIREIMSHQEEGIRMYEGMLYRKPINIVRKEELRALIWERLHESREVNIDRKVKAKGKTVSPQVRNLITSLYNLVLYDVERRLPEELYMDIGHFRSGLYDHVLELNRSLLLELERLSAFDKDHLSETEANELKVRNQTEIEMCARAIALYARQVVSLPQSRQTTERLIKEPEETGTHIPEKKEDTVRPVDTETLRLRKERLLQQATTPQKDFLKQELDFYEINEKTDSELPLGTRVEPKSKRALLQASLRRPGAEAAARLEAAEETFGTVVSHVAEDEEQVIVHWDNPDESFLYHESNVQAIMRQVPRKIMREQQVGIGVFVEKSATWTFEDQAGPVGVGTVIRHDLETGLVQVKWHGGVPGWNSYRTAEDVETRTECFIDGEE